MKLDLKFGINHIIIAALIFITVIIWTSLLNATQLTIDGMMRLGMLGTNLGNIFSFNFILFLIVFPLTLAIIAAACKKTERKQMYMISIIPAAAAMGVAFLLFPNISSYWLVGLFYIVGIPLMIETAYINYDELKHLVTIRTLGRSAGRAMFIVLIGFFILTLLTALDNQETHVQEFEDKLISMIGGGQTTGPADLTQMGMGMTYGMQKEMIEGISETEQYQKLLEKEDPDVQEFVAMIEMYKNISEQEFMEMYEDEMGQSSIGSAMPTMSIFDMLKQKIPLFGMFEEFMWLFNTIGLTGIFLFISGIIIKPLAVLYGVILSKLI